MLPFSRFALVFLPTKMIGSFLIGLFLLAGVIFGAAQAAENTSYIEQNRNLTDKAGARKITFLSERQIRYEISGKKSVILEIARLPKAQKIIYAAAPSDRELLLIEKKGSALFVTSVLDGAKKPELAVFADRALPVPQRKERISPPPSKTEFFTTQEFLTSYAFWSPKIVLSVYDTLPEKHRNLILIFPYLRTDLATRFCGARSAGAGVFEALNGQQTDCKTLLQKFNRVRETPAKFAAFKQKTERENALAKSVIDCSQGMASVKNCQQNSRDVARNLRDPVSIAEILQ